MEVDARLVIECSFGGGVERKSLRLFCNPVTLWVMEKYEIGYNLIRAMVNLAGIHTLFTSLLRHPFFIFIFQNSSTFLVEINHKNVSGFCYKNQDQLHS